jgi:hypothetical protein
MLRLVQRSMARTTRGFSLFTISRGERMPERVKPEPLDRFAFLVVSLATLDCDNAGANGGRPQVVLDPHRAAARFLATRFLAGKDRVVIVSVQGFSPPFVQQLCEERVHVRLRLRHPGLGAFLQDAVNAGFPDSDIGAKLGVTVHLWDFARACHALAWSLL